MNDQEPLSATELRQAHEWRTRWNGLKYLLLAFKKLMLWIAGVGAGLLVLWDLFARIGGGDSK